MGQIKNFMDKDRRVSIETISAQFAVSVGTVHTIIREELKMRKICAKFVPRVLREDQKERRCHESREMINSDPAVLGDLRWKLNLLVWHRDQETEFPVEACWLSQTLESQTEHIHPQTFDDPSFWLLWHDLYGLGSHWTYNQQGILLWGFKGVQHSSNRVSGISSRTMHQSTTPSLSQTTWPRWESRQFLTVPMVQTLLPVTFGYSLSSEAVVMGRLRRWKRLWRRSVTRSHKRTSMGPSRSCRNGTTSALQPEEITSKGTRVSCVCYL